MALADGLELPGTYGITRDRIVILLAGGAAAFYDLPGGPEDDAAQAATEVADAGLDAGDCLIAVSASGTTPYAVGALDEAARRGAAHHRHRQQCGHAAARTGRCRRSCSPRRRR